MTEVDYKRFPQFLAGLQKSDSGEGRAQVYLIHGEELLCQTVADALVNTFLPPSQRAHGYFGFEGTGDTVPDVVEQMNTYSLLGDEKVVCIRDARFFYSKEDGQKLLEKAKAAFDQNQIKKAAGCFVSLLALLDISLEDLPRADYNCLKIKSDLLKETDWLETLKQFCVENRLRIPRGHDSAAMLQQAIEKGFPGSNRLLITADMVDKRRTLYKAIKTCGTVIDCSVPKGDRKADRAVQETVVREKMESVLSRYGKKMDHRAYLALYEMTGFDLRIFVSSLEKLALYVGQRQKITVEDVSRVLQRTKKDPIYELTNALAARDLGKALFFTGSLLADNIYPLQILAALTNQVRKLLLVKDFTAGPAGRCWNASMSYNQFQAQVMPAVADHDGMLLALLEQWHETRPGGKAPDPAPKKKAKPGKTAKKGTAGTELVIAKNPRSPYPIYLMFKNSEKFTLKALLDAMVELSAADIRLKSTGQKPKLILEDLLFKLCR